MKKYLVYMTCAAAAMIGGTGCSDFGDVNMDPEHLNSENIPTELLFTNGQHQMLGSDWDVWRNGCIYAAQWMSHTASFNWLGNANYTWNDGYSGVYWEIYNGDTRGALRDMKDAVEAWKEDPSRQIDYQIARIMLAYGMHRMTDLYGDIPYSQAVQPELYSFPEYDTQQSIYMDLLKELNEAQAALNGASAAAMKSADNFYQGDASKWRKFANALQKSPGPHSTNCRTETKRGSTMTEQEIVMMAAEVAAKAAVAAVRAILGKEIQESVEAAVTDAARLGAEASIKAVEQERKKFRDGRSDRRFRNTKLLLRNYTVLNANCSHAVYDAASAATGEESVEEIVEALDELLEENLKVESIMKSAARTQLIMRHVNRMLGIYKVVCENSVDEGEQRHYRVIEALYLRDRPLSPTAVAEREKIDKRTVYKDVDAACATLSALIFGIDGIKKA